MAKIIAVIGATGGQGGSVVSILHGNPAYHVRAITRNLGSPKARELAFKGVEVVQANLDDLESLISAFKGASYVFSVTDFWELFEKHGPVKAMEIEFAQGRNAAIAASRTPTLEHFVWSTLPDAMKHSKGRFYVPHFQAKVQVDHFIRADEKLWAKSTLLLVGYYMDNFQYPVFAPNNIESSGKYVQLLPVGPQTEMALAGNHKVNTGLFVEAILRQPHLTQTKAVVQVTDAVTKGEMLQAWGKATGNAGNVELIKIPLEDYERLFPRWGFEMGGMLKYFEWSGGWKNSWVGDDEALTEEDLGVVGVERFEEGLNNLYKGVLG